ncbi:hypothetical protein L9F63_024447, partial [Diploptera punctata]
IISMIIAAVRRPDACIIIPTKLLAPDSQRRSIFSLSVSEVCNIKPEALTLMRISPTITPKTTQIIDDYEISNTVLGLGISGKVVQCYSKKTREKYALKVLHDNTKARREVDLHWRASGCRHIVNIIDVYENTYSGNKCLLVVMECMEGGELFQRIQDRQDGAFTERDSCPVDSDQDARHAR